MSSSPQFWGSGFRGSEKCFLKDKTLIQIFLILCPVWTIESQVLHPKFRVPGLGAWNSALRTKFDHMKKFNLHLEISFYSQMLSQVPSPKSQVPSSGFQVPGIGVWGWVLDEIWQCCLRFGLRVSGHPEVRWYLSWTSSFELMPETRKNINVKFHHAKPEPWVPGAKSRNLKSRKLWFIQLNHWITESRNLEVETWDSK
jgi:hypothetical protein